MKTRLRKYWNTKWGLWMYAVDWWYESTTVPNPYVTIYDKEPAKKPYTYPAGWWDWPTKPTTFGPYSSGYGWTTPDENAARELAQRLSIDPGAMPRVVIAEFSDGVEFKPMEPIP